MQPAENQCIEWKESWKDDCLQEICAFANAQGGSLFIGIDNTGGVVGITEKACKKLTEDLPNKVLSKLGIVVDVNTREKNGVTYLEIA
ncbi:MAG: ATP-binding protein, partial [Akkermansia sp.]|nr:ATP-binding protein [Akkermansia sp.]